MWAHPYDPHSLRACATYDISQLFERRDEFLLCDIYGAQTFLNSFPHMHTMYNFLEGPGNHWCDVYPSLNFQPRIMHFAYSDWFTQSWLSAHIP